MIRASERNTALLSRARQIISDFTEPCFVGDYLVKLEVKQGGILEVEGQRDIFHPRTEVEVSPREVIAKALESACDVNDKWSGTITIRWTGSTNKEVVRIAKSEKFFN